MSGIILIYYSLTDQGKNEEWEYNSTKFPPTWICSGFGELTNNQYNYLEEFRGDLEHEALMLQYLHGFFNDLHNNKIVSKYTFKLI